MSNVIYLTPEGLEKLKAELEHLKTVRRFEIAEKLKEAIEFGDLSENSEYEDARNEQALVEKRISDIEDQLKHVELIDESESDNKVKIGSSVTIEKIGDPESRNTYKIVGSTESDILADTPKISNESPIGRALLGKKVGGKIKVKALGGTFEYKVIDFK